MEKIPNVIYDPYYLVQDYSKKVALAFNIGDQKITVCVREYETETRWSVYVHNGHFEAVGTATQYACAYTPKSNRTAFCEAYHIACKELGITPIEVG